MSMRMLGGSCVVRILKRRQYDAWRMYVLSGAMSMVLRVMLASQADIVCLNVYDHYTPK